jgi:hypothetical protein
MDDLQAFMATGRNSAMDKPKGLISSVSQHGYGHVYGRRSSIIPKALKRN